VYRNYHEGLESLETLKQNFKTERNILKKTAAFVYYIFYILEAFIIHLGSLFALRKHQQVYKLKKKIGEIEGVKYKKHFSFMIRLWSLLGTGTHFFIMMIFLAAGFIDQLLSIFIWYSLITLAVLLVIQNFVFLFYKVPEQRDSVEKQLS